MSISVSAKGGATEHATAGVHQAVCSGVYDMGEQDGFQGKRVRKIAIMWELDQRYTEGEYAGKRIVVANTYSAYFTDKSNLRKLVEGWFGLQVPDTVEEYDVETLLGKQCCLNMVINEKGYANMQSIMPIMANMQPMFVETPGYIPKWICEKAPHLKSSTDSQSTGKAPLTIDTFNKAIENVLSKNLDIQPEAFKRLWDAVENKRSEISTGLYNELKSRFDQVVNPPVPHFDDLSVPFEF